MKKYYVIIHGIYKNPENLTPGAAVLGGPGGELHRGGERFFEAKNDNEAEKEAQRIVQYYLSSQSEWEKMDRVEKIEIYRLVRPVKSPVKIKRKAQVQRVRIFSSAPDDSFDQRGDGCPF